MKPIESAYINALLADASYVSLSSGRTGDDLVVDLDKRMTTAQATFIAANFDVKNAEISPTCGFDAVVWYGRAGTDYAGKVYVSIRGTQETQDFIDDGDLASAGVPYRQIVSMVNWWLQVTTASGQQALQIKTDADNNFVAAPTVESTGVLGNITAIESVNAHSLGGYMATAFARLFGQQWGVQGVSTFNSAGFNRLRADNKIQTAFSQVTQLIGTGLGLGNFDAVAGLQKNYFAENGINVTTTITDSDGLGGIKVIAADNSETILGTGTIKKLTTSDNTWQSEDKRFTYTTSQEGDGSTTLLISGAGVTARVNKFTSGHLGITLPEAPAAQAAPLPIVAVHDLSTSNGWTTWIDAITSTYESGRSAHLRAA